MILRLGAVVKSVYIKFIFKHKFCRLAQNSTKVFVNENKLKRFRIVENSAKKATQKAVLPSYGFSASDLFADGGYAICKQSPFSDTGYPRGS